MKYKVGDKVRIKTWKEMEKEYGVNEEEDINTKNCLFSPEMEKELIALNTDRIVTIREVRRDHYSIKNLYVNWTDRVIKEKIDPSDFILNRFEILDL